MPGGSGASVLDRPIDTPDRPASVAARPLLAIENLSVEFQSMAGTVKAVSGLSLSVGTGNRDPARP